MILDKALLIKGLGGVAACTALGCGGTVLVNHYISNANEKELAELISKVGLDCKTPSATGTECTKVTTEGSKINVKQSNETTGKFEIDTITGGKIKLYKLAGDNTGYHKNLKFVIEDGDITKDSNKLEQFETYEIEEAEESGTKKYYLKRKFTKSEAIKKDLGLPENCNLPNGTSSSCNNVSLDSGKLSNLNFKDKDSDGAKIATNGTVTLTITKETTDTNIFTDGYKFSFQPTEEVTISSTNKIAKNSGTEFKIKKEGNTLTLEKAWSADALAKKAGLTGCDTSTKECTLPTETNLKLYNGANDKVENGKVTNNSQKIKYEEDKEGYNQGFKFFTEQEIALSADSKKIEASTAATYEIKQQTADNTTNWYLTKKTTSGGAGG